MEINGILDKEFKIRVIKVLIEVRKTMSEQSENFNQKNI